MIDDKVVLFTKSYSGDFKRVENLAESIEKYNVDDLEWYISVPEEDVKLFDSISNATIISDEEILGGSGWVHQQFVKVKFYELEIAQYVFWIDSDSYFIRDFRKTDFVTEAGIPYIVKHTSQDLWEWTSRYKNTLGFDPKKSWEREIDTIREFFGIELTERYDYGPSPCIWDMNIWETINAHFNLEELFSIVPSEIKWYGELVHPSNNFLPRGPYFKVFHYEPQYSFYKQLGYTQEHFAENYFGIVMQSNWNAPIKY